MSTFTLTKTRFMEGVWEGVLQSEDGATDAPIIRVTLQDMPIDSVKVTPLDDGRWTLRIPIPASAIADGVHSFLIRDALSDETLDVITILAGEVLSEDIRAEMDLLRAELDMLKRAFRRHCVETT